MTTILDGPAKGQTLMLKRAPKYLRVVRDDKHSLSPKWDALDQIGDTPMGGETCFAYLLQGKPGVIHLNMGRGKGGFYPVAEYALCETQPTEEEFRSTALWQRVGGADGIRENQRQRAMNAPKLCITCRWFKPYPHRSQEDGDCGRTWFSLVTGDSYAPLGQRAFSYRSHDGLCGPTGEGWEEGRPATERIPSQS